MECEYPKAGEVYELKEASDCGRAQYKEDVLCRQEKVQVAQRYVLSTF
jgi:hypothetical protein